MDDNFDMKFDIEEISTIITTDNEDGLHTQHVALSAAHIICHFRPTILHARQEFLVNLSY